MRCLNQVCMTVNERPGTFFRAVTRRSNCRTSLSPPILACQRSMSRRHPRSGVICFVSVSTAETRPPLNRAAAEFRGACGANPTHGRGPQGLARETSPSRKKIASADSGSPCANRLSACGTEQHLVQLDHRHLPDSLGVCLRRT